MICCGVRVQGCMQVLPQFIHLSLRDNPPALIISNLQKSVEVINVVRRGHEFHPSLTGQRFFIYFFECVHFIQINFPLKKLSTWWKKENKKKKGALWICWHYRSKSEHCAMKERSHGCARIAQRSVCVVTHSFVNVTSCNPSHTAHSIHFFH